MMRTVAILLTTLVATISSALTLSEGGKTTVVIVVATDAIPAERTAARELQEHLRQVTGATFEIREGKDIAEGARQIIVGQASQKLGPDGIEMRVTGNKLLLAGARPRGTLC